MPYSKLSRYAIATPFPNGVLLSHAISGERLFIEHEVAGRILDLRDRIFADTEFLEHIGGEGADALLSILRRRHLLVADGIDEEEQASRFLGSGADGDRWGSPRMFWRPETLTARFLAAIPPHQTVQPLRIVGYGGCVLDFLRDDLEREGLHRGLEVSLATRWPQSSRVIEIDNATDMVVLQLPILPYLTRLLDGGPLGPPGARRTETSRIKRLYTRWIAALGEALPDRSIALVHNLAPSALSPYGRFENSVDYNTRQALFEINHHVDQELRQDSRLLLLDEERLTARYGALSLWDDSVFLFGHHGGSVDPGIEMPHQAPDLSRALAVEYLNLYEAATGRSRVKCVVTDLDGTLWPGIAADDGFDWLDVDVTSTWAHLGLHQALHLLKNRGVLLATASKGSAEATLRAWRQARHSALLTPDDFVLHRINWHPKSDNIAEIAAALGFAPDAILFLDDNPAERFEVMRRLPAVRVLDAEVPRFRGALLDSPLLDRPAGTAEARHRTDSTAAMLRRAEVAAAIDDTTDLLAELEVAVDVFPAAEENTERVTELFSRTNQYTTTSWRPSEREVRRLIANSGTDLILCRVRDKFADYGLVGAAAIIDGRIACVAVSCRVIGLDIGPVLLAAAVRLADCAKGGLRGGFVRSGQNEPAADLFIRVGFRSMGDGEFELRSADDLVPLDRFPHRVALWPRIPQGGGQA